VIVRDLGECARIEAPARYVEDRVRARGSAVNVALQAEATQFLGLGRAAARRQPDP
jgi:hypothetical protein